MLQCIRMSQISLLWDTLRPSNRNLLVKYPIIVMNALEL